MTKKAMVDFIETTNRVIDFDRNFLMRKTKKELEELYLIVKEQEEKNPGQYA